MNVKIIRNAWRTSVLYFQSSPNWVLALHPANCACAPKEKVLIEARVFHTEWTYSPRSCQSSGQQCHWERHPSLSNSKKVTDSSFGQSRLQDLHWPWNNNLLETILAKWSLCLISRRVWTSNLLAIKNLEEEQSITSSYVSEENAESSELTRMWLQKFTPTMPTLLAFLLALIQTSRDWGSKTSNVSILCFASSLPSEPNLRTVAVGTLGNYRWGKNTSAGLFCVLASSGCDQILGGIL